MSAAGLAEEIGQLHEATHSRGNWFTAFNKLRDLELDMDMSDRIAHKKKNTERNRYTDVIPNDESRVLLDSKNDYINASHVTTRCSSCPALAQPYILTQGPLINTATHFWQMVWEQKVCDIVMVTNLVESNRQKCHPYFPVAEQPHMTWATPGHTFQVQLLSEDVYSNEVDEGVVEKLYVLRKFKLTYCEGDAEREISHWNYIGWPDHGVPDTPDTFAQFFFSLMDAGALDSKPVVHCSAGIGRSGVVITVDSCRRMLEAGCDVNYAALEEIILAARKARTSVVQTYEQLSFSAYTVSTFHELLEKKSALLAALKKTSVQFVPPAESPNASSTTEPVRPTRRPTDNVSQNNASPAKVIKTSPENLPPRPDRAAQPPPPLPERAISREDQRKNAEEMISNMKKKLREHNVTSSSSFRRFCSWSAANRPIVLACSVAVVAAAFYGYTKTSSALTG